MLWSESFFLSYRAWSLQFAFFWVMLFAALYCSSYKGLRLFTFLPVLAASCVAALALLQYYGHDLLVLPHLRLRGVFDLGFLVMAKRPETDVKLYSFLGHRNYVAGYLSAVVPLIVASLLLRIRSLRALYSCTQLRRPWYLGKDGAFFLLELAALLLSTSVVVLSHTRGAWLALGVALFLFFLVLLKHFRFETTSKAFGLLLALLMVFSSFVALWPKANRMKQSAVKRLQSTVDLKRGSVNERILFLKSACRMIFSSWTSFFFGKGIGTYPIHHIDFQAKIINEEGGERFWKVGNRTWYAHNELLNFWAETGLVGVLLIFSFLYFAFGALFSRISSSSKEPERVILLLSVFSSLIAVLFHNLFTFSLHLPTTGLLFYSLVGSACAGVGGLCNLRLSGAWRYLLLLFAFLLLVFVLCLVVSAIKVEMLWSQSFRQIQNAALERAIISMEKATTIEQEQPPLIFDYGRILQDNGRSRAALKRYSSIERVFKDSTIQYNLANCYWESGMKEKAESYFQEALWRDPIDHRGLYYYGRFLLSQARFREAREYLRRGLKYHRKNGDLLFLAGLTALGQKRDQAAKDYFERIRELEEDNPQSAALQRLLPAMKAAPDGGRAIVPQALKKKPHSLILNVLAHRLGLNGDGSGREL